MARILGIDPGSVVMGYAVIEQGSNSLRYVASGCLRLPKGSRPERLHAIYIELTELIGHHQPTVAAVEEVFVSQNVSSAIKLGQARGVAIAAAVSSGLPVYEYAARKVKQAITGTGRATKQQVQHMVGLLLELTGMPAADAADALAIAICHVNTLGLDRRPPGTRTR